MFAGSTVSDLTTQCRQLQEAIALLLKECGEVRFRTNQIRWKPTNFNFPQKAKCPEEIEIVPFGSVQYTLDSFLFSSSQEEENCDRLVEYLQLNNAALKGKGALQEWRDRDQSDGSGAAGMAWATVPLPCRVAAGVALAAAMWAAYTRSTTK